MNLPAVVKKSFDQLQNQPEYVAVINFVLEGLKKLSNPLQRARYVHSQVNAYNVEPMNHPLVKELSPCKLGCSACCHTQVSVTEDEAQLLVHHIQQGMDVDVDRLVKQHATGNDFNAFMRLSFDERKCVFLDEQGACRVYEDRPSVCRTNAVLGRADQCDTSDSVMKPTRLVRTPKSDMAIYASFLLAKESGTLPYMVGELLVARAPAE